MEKKINQTPRRRDYVPALGRHELTQDYDRIIAVMTRERRWRADLLRLVAPAPGQTVLDVGCGTGSFAIMLKQACPDARVIGVDPDESVLSIARAKAQVAGVDIEWRCAMGDELGAAVPEAVDKAVSSLVLHQCALPMKVAILSAVRDRLKAGCATFIADYGEQRTLLMRLLFLQVQRLDGFENTQPNADGALPGLMERAGFAAVVEHRAIPTPTGSISLYSGVRPGPGARILASASSSPPV
jgi:2-polyprenyl-3-methyl-5-hydroxy-6-metoxy-1,4-benzoquinol methylase